MIEIWELNRIDSGAILATTVGLFLFGWLFNQIVNFLHRRGLNEGFTWLEVVIGVGVVVIASGFTIGWGTSLLLFIYFAASGIWMAAGDIWRGIRAKQAEVRERREDAR